ncbi:MAG: CDP-glycerol glycerophosphotransferase family protein [Actinobacteria bacterium]|nr:CDP-glycerol glycerophosphotransferase family protein [Actinomycetota bacterium]
MTTVMFESWRGRYSDSPRAVAEYLRAARPETTQYWVVDSGDSFPDWAQLVPRHRPDYFRRLITSDFVISNDIVSRHYLHGPGVTYVQCWHGIALKAIGFHDNKGGYVGNRAQLRRTRRDVRKWDYLVSPCPAITPIVRSAFEYDGKVLEIGMPRNDILSRDTDNAIRSRVRAELGLVEDAPVMLYAPTWRDDDRDDQGRLTQSVVPDWEAILSAIPGLQILFRTHKNVIAQAPDLPGLKDVSSYPDVAELYLAADVLLSDYSSTIIDFAVTGRPIVCYAPDLEHYRNDLRAMYFDYEEWAPGPIVTQTDDLIDCLRDLPAVAAAYSAQYDGFVRKFCPYEDGHATQRLVEAVGLLD